MAGDQAATVTSAVRIASLIQACGAKAASLIDRLIFVAASALLGFVSVALFLQVFFRYVVKQPLSWSEESARFALVWLAMLSGAIAARSGQHFAFRWALLRLPPPVHRGLRQVTNVATVVFLLIILRQSITYLAVVSNQTATATGLNLRWAYGGITGGLVMLIVFYILEMVDGACSLLTRERLSIREAAEIEVEAMFGRGDSTVDSTDPKVRA